jgi:hypothetical protein
MEMFFLVIAIACILTALLAAFATLGLSPAIEKIGRSDDQGRLHRGTYLGSFGRLVSLMATLSRSAIE